MFLTLLHLNLLQAGANIYSEARLGAWAWGSSSSEVLRVGAGMAEPYNAAWCAIEYWEAEGSILGMLLEHVSANTEHQGRSLLCHAILCGNVAAVEMLIRFGAEIEYRVSADDGSQLFPIHLAARQGTASVLRTLVAHGCDVNAKTEAGETALMLCAMLGHEECFRELLLGGADLGAVNRAGQTVVEIMDASSHRLTLHRVIWEVILSGKLLHSSNIDLFSVLHFVARYGGTKVMEKILEQKNVNLNLQDRDRFSALMVAARYGNVEALKVLLFAGASISIRNSEGETAAMLADRFGHKEAYEQVLVDALLCDALRDADFKALHFAAKRGNLEALAYLLKQGSLVNAWDEDGYTPLMLSVREGHIEACKLLLSFGADCYLANSRGEMALSIARRFVGGKVIEGMLLDHMAKKLVLAGGEIGKHTREGKGDPHSKHVKMLKTGILSWGRSKRRNVACIETSLGASSKFQKNRKNHGDTSNPGLFRVVTNQREIHFDAVTAFAAELWVRGIKIIAKEAIDKNDLYSG
jgi:ankyrin repeat protein